MQERLAEEEAEREAKAERLAEEAEESRAEQAIKERNDSELAGALNMLKQIDALQMATDDDMVGTWILYDGGSEYTDTITEDGKISEDGVKVTENGKQLKWNECYYIEGSGWYYKDMKTALMVCIGDDYCVRICNVGDSGYLTSGDV